MKTYYNKKKATKKEIKKKGEVYKNMSFYNCPCLNVCILHDDKLELNAKAKELFQQCLRDSDHAVSSLFVNSNKLVDNLGKCSLDVDDVNSSINIVILFF